MKLNLSSVLWLGALAPGLLAGEAVTYLDGREVAGQIRALKDGALVIEGVSEPVPLYELSALQFGPSDREAEADPNAGPISMFQGGELLRARVVKAEGHTAQLDIGGLKLEVPTEALRAFRLREAHPGDDLFETDLKSPTPPSKDTVYVRRGNTLLRVEGVLQKLDEEFLSLEYEGQERKLRRQLVLGVVLAPVASASAEEGLPAEVELRRGGQIPAVLAGLRTEGETQLLLRFRGAAKGALCPLAAKEVARVKLSSDRVVFLGSRDPVKVEETPFIGTQPAFPWRKDLAVGGGALKLGGKTHRKGLGMTSRSALEYELGGQFKLFSALIGLDDSAGAGSGVTFRVIADAKEIYKKDMTRASPPESISLPVPDVRRLRLEVDYGEDGVDFGDYADWVDARLTK